MATRDLKGLTIEIGGDTSNLATALRDVDGELSNLQNNLRTVNSALRLDPGNVDALAERQNLLNDAVRETTRRLETLREAQRQADRQIADGVEVDEQAYRNLRSEIIRAEASLNDYERQAADAGDTSSDAADESAEGWTVVKDVIADLASEAVQALIESFRDLLFESEKALDKLQAKLGVSDKAMRKYGDIAEEVFKEGFGESITDVTEALGTIGNMLGDLDKTDLKRVTENAMTLSDVFGWDVQESVRAAKSLMNQFGITSDEAFNLMIQGAQNGLDQNSDLIDTVNEYSVKFREAGYSADDMFNMLANGAKTGTWSVDKLGDAFKEMSIRVSDGTIADAILDGDLLEWLSWTSDEAGILARSLNIGGEKAEEAMGEILRELSEVEDAVAKQKLGVAIFGTMWEDLGEDAVMALLNTEGGIKSVNNAMDQVKTDAYDNLSASVSTLGRTLKAEILQPIVNAIAPAIKGLVDWAIENMDILKPIIMGVATAFAILAGALAIQGIITAVQKAFAILNATLLANPIMLVVAGLAGLAAGLISLISSLGDASDKMKENADAVTAFGDQIANATPKLINVNEILSTFGNSLDDITVKISENEQKITDIISKAMSEQRDLRDEEIESIEKYNDEIARLQEEKLEIYRQAMNVELIKIQDEMNSMTQEQAAEHVATLEAQYAQMNEAATANYDAQLGQLYNYYQARGMLDSEEYAAARETARANHEAELQENQNYLNQGLQMVSEAANGWITADAEKWNTVIEGADTGHRIYKKALEDLNLDTANAFLEMVASVKQNGGELTEANKANAAAMLGAFDGLPTMMEEQGATALRGMVKGLEDEIPALANASDMSSQEIVDALRDGLGLDRSMSEPEEIGKYTLEGLENIFRDARNLKTVKMSATGVADTVVDGLESKNGEMENIGEEMVEGVNTGMQSKESWIGKKIGSFASRLVSSFKAAFKIQSPSRIMRDQIGAMLAEGIGEGIEENADAATDPMKALKDELTAFDGMSVSKSISINADASRNEAKHLASEMREMHSLLAEYLPYLAKKTGMYVNGKHLVGELIEDIDEGLGEIANRRAAGAV